jgi:hypothetical protein
MQQHREERCNPKWVIFATFLAKFAELHFQALRAARWVVHHFYTSAGRYGKVHLRMPMAKSA